MKRLVTAILLDVRLQVRYGLYAVTVLVVAVWAIALWGFGSKVFFAHRVESVSAAIYTMIGFIAIVRYDSINEFMIPSMGYVFALVVPLVGHFGFVDSVFFLPHPVEMALVLMRGAYASEPGWKIAVALLGLVAWFAATFVWARHRFDRFVVRTTGA